MNSVLMSIRVVCFMTKRISYWKRKSNFIPLLYYKNQHLYDTKKHSKCLYLKRKWLLRTWKNLTLELLDNLSLPSIYASLLIQIKIVVRLCFKKGFTNSSLPTGCQRIKNSFLLIKPIKIRMQYIPYLLRKLLKHKDERKLKWTDCHLYIINVYYMHMYTYITITVVLLFLHIKISKMCLYAKYRICFKIWNNLGYKIL